MKNSYKYLIILLFIIIFSCKEKKLDRVYFPYKNRNENLSFEKKIKISSFKSFIDFEKKMDSLYDNNKYPLIFLKDSTNSYYVEYFEQGGCTNPIYKRKNLIGISKDSICKSGQYFKSEKLYNVLKTDLLNYGSNIEFAESHEKLNIRFLNLYSEPTKNIEFCLLELIKTFNKIQKETKDSLHLNIRFEQYGLYFKHPEKII